MMVTCIRVCWKVKCECYMPESGAVYGDIQVTVRDCQTDATFGCTRRRLVLKVDSISSTQVANDR